MEVSAASSPNVAAQALARPPVEGTAAREVRQEVRENLTQRPQQTQAAAPQQESRQPEPQAAPSEAQEARPSLNTAGQTVGRIVNTTA